MVLLNCWQETVDSSMEVAGTVTKHWQLCSPLTYVSINAIDPFHVCLLFKETFC